MKKSKKAYYNKYFETNWNTKYLISPKTVASNESNVLSLDNGHTITNHSDVVNTIVNSN